ncbi:lysine-specific demethylase 4C-like [Stegodyphus dumicola]|uniref:lysine-specific demethylase 4C-like n=1 Tax=Stegodyphus dumicola TaxID=202533 RepID=UPI0015AE1C62|nr:lysine-specific demethylase 4C-like [Stegodyphus dumicola]XP_035228873.1 lysine-specific demethylase 4C-like [Stegodyphus dumicola]
MSSTGGSSVPRIQVFRPTMEEFKNFSKYIEKIESLGAHKAGLAKIIPPEGWCPRKKGYDDIDLIIPAPISQVVTGRGGLYQQLNIQQRAMTVKEFKKLAESNKFKTPPHFDYEDLERKYWKNITYNSPIYGADVSGSLYDDGVEEFNIQHLNTILDMVKEDYEIQIEGVNTAYLYFGMWKTTFAWHTEDMDLYSINYLHFGAPKSWYVVPPEHGRRLERLAAGFFHGSHQTCSAFLRHKMTIISPHVLKQYSIPCNKITQEPGEFMITFPFGYHSGFNHGFNCAESTNFALPRWIEYGKRTMSCTCRNDCVKICMDMFVRKFQPDRYELWKAGKDFGTHPEDPSRHYAAPAPKKLELALSAQREERKKAKESQKIKRHPISKKLEQKKEIPEVCEAIPRHSDNEETELYDVNEVIHHKNKKKQLKKEVMEDNNIEQMEIVADPDEKNDEITKKLDVQDSPPQLKPFWDPETEKIKNNGEKEIVPDNVKDDYQRHVELLEKYPQLKQAINSGTMSVVLINPSSAEKSMLPLTPVSTQCESNFKSKGPQSLKPSYTFTASNFSNTVFSQTWRCEQINNSLKIKFVQPKKIQQNVIETHSNNSVLSSSNDSVLPQTSLKCAVVSNAKSEMSNESQKSLTTKDCSSDESKNVNNIRVKRADGSQDNWAQPLAELWHHQAFNFEAECNFNEKLSSIPPHCAVCVIFTPMHTKNSFPSEPVNVPSYSAVKMPVFCYGNSLNSECLLDTNSLLRRDGTAPLLICSVCKICVHATCYGISMLPMRSWMCTRCTKQAAEAECCLCVLRGGALKPTTDGRWAHIVCAVLIPETYFESTVLKQPINVLSITSNRQRLKCKYCFKSSCHKDSKGTCVQCQSGKCYLPFHVTCGYMAGVIFETSDWPEPIHMICTRHASARRKPTKRQLTNVSVGERVIAKHTNRRYYWANVKKKYMQEYYSILFEDNSHSTNTLPEDIVSRNVAIHGSPQINEKVKVKWTDDKIYNGIFKGSQSCELYVIEFDDGSVLHQERKQIYAADEDLPKEVQSKMSHSSERRSHDFVSETEGKRIRISNHKYLPN